MVMGCPFINPRSPTYVRDVPHYSSHADGIEKKKKSSASHHSFFLLVSARIVAWLLNAASETYCRREFFSFSEKEKCILVHV